MDLLQKVALPHNDNYIAKRQAHDGSMKLYTMLCCSKVIESNVCFNIRTLEDDIIFHLNQLQISSL